MTDGASASEQLSAQEIKAFVALAEPGADYVKLWEESRDGLSLPAYAKARLMARAVGYRNPVGVGGYKLIVDAYEAACGDLQSGVVSESTVGIVRMFLYGTQVRGEAFVPQPPGLKMTEEGVAFRETLCDMLLNLERG